MPLIEWLYSTLALTSHQEKTGLINKPLGFNMKFILIFIALLSELIRIQTQKVKGITQL